MNKLKSQLYLIIILLAGIFFLLALNIVLETRGGEVTPTPISEVYACLHFENDVE